MKITFVGDTHGIFNAITQVNIKNQSDCVIQCGDFGIWPGLYHKVKINPNNIPIYFCRGNHENHDVLDTYPEFEISNLKNGPRIIHPYLVEKRNYNKTNLKKLLKIQFPKADNIFFCNNGSILDLNGISILFIGGALSIDQHLRLIGKSWWPQEILRNNEIEYILNIQKNIDIIVSHTCPKFLMPFLNFENSEKYKDPVSLFLNEVYDIFKPEMWFCGHFHIGKTIKYHNTIFNILNTCNENSFEPGFFSVLEI